MLFATSNNPPVSDPRKVRLTTPTWWEAVREFCNTYRQLWAFIVSVNVTLLVLGSRGIVPYFHNQSASCALGNILVALLARSEILLRCLHVITLSLFAKWAPLRLRNALVNFFLHFGGIHTGCALSGLMWVLYITIDLYISTVSDTSTKRSVQRVFGIVASWLLLFSALAAIPPFRQVRHNIFERTHRFAGWSALVALWIFIILSLGYSPVDHQFHSDPHTFITAPQLWLSVALTILLIVPWITVHRVPVTALVTSPKVCILKFKGGIQRGLLGRISRSPLFEWHAFGITSASTSPSDDHYMVIVAQGDWTKKLVDDPPTSVWVRGIRFAGTPFFIPLYRRALVVVTGTAIGVVLSSFLQADPVRDAGIHLIWIASGLQKTFGDEYAALLDRLPPSAFTLWDTKVSGRPDVGVLIEDKVREIDAEAVFITSNQQGSEDMRRLCRRKGITAFAPIWDS